jgi:hypothetical protein
LWDFKSSRRRVGSWLPGVPPCSLVDSYGRFIGAYCFHYKGDCPVANVSITFYGSDWFVTSKLRWTLSGVCGVVSMFDVSGICLRSSPGDRFSYWNSFNGLIPWSRVKVISVQNSPPFVEPRRSLPCIQKPSVLIRTYIEPGDSFDALISHIFKICFNVNLPSASDKNSCLFRFPH